MGNNMSNITGHSSELAHPRTPAEVRVRYLTAHATAGTSAFELATKHHAASSDRYGSMFVQVEQLAGRRGKRGEAIKTDSGPVYTYIPLKGNKAGAPFIYGGSDTMKYRGAVETASADQLVGLLTTSYKAVQGLRLPTIFKPITEGLQRTNATFMLMQPGSDDPAPM